MSASTARVDFVQAFLEILQAQATATPELLVGAYSARPGSFRQLPLAYVGDRNETITHDSGTRTRLFAGIQVVAVDAYTDNTQTADRFDRLVDALVDRFTAAHSYVAKHLIQMTSVTDTELEVRGSDGQTTYYRAAVFTFDESFVKEGRD